MWCLLMVFWFNGLMRFGSMDNGVKLMRVV